MGSVKVTCEAAAASPSGQEGPFKFPSVGHGGGSESEGHSADDEPPIISQLPQEASRNGSHNNPQWGGVRLVGVDRPSPQHLGDQDSKDFQDPNMGFSSEDACAQRCDFDPMEFPPPIPRGLGGVVGEGPSGDLGVPTGPLRKCMASWLVAGGSVLIRSVGRGRQM